MVLFHLVLLGKFSNLSQLLAPFHSTFSQLVLQSGIERTEICNNFLNIGAGRWDQRLILDKHFGANFYLHPSNDSSPFQRA